MSKPPQSQKPLFSLYIFNTFIPWEALFFKPKTVENRHQSHVRLVEAPPCVRRTLGSAQIAPKMRQDGPDDRFGSFLSALMAPQIAPKSKKNPSKKQSKSIMQKQYRKITLPRRTGRGSTIQAQAGGPPTPSVLASPGRIPSHL